MGLFDRFRKVQASDGYSFNAGEFYGAWQLSTEAYERIMGLSAAEMWRTQPYLRTVVTFLARNIAQLALHTYQRQGENDRQRLRDGGMAAALARPNRGTTAYELVYGLVADLALYDTAYWLLSPDPEQRISRLPVSWVTPKGGDALGPELYEVKSDDKGQAVRIPASEVLAFHGWHPSNLAAGASPVHALRELLAEQVQAARYREAVWRRGGKVGAVLTRPPAAPEWSDEARKRFKADWEARFTGDGPGVGGTPMLEDGMTLTRVDFNAHDMQFIEGSRLALNTVASVYHINPTMIGLLDNANYSNVREFRRMLYGDTLGPTLAMIEDRLNTFLVPLLDARPGVYVEFNIEEKLQGNFEEQTAALQTSVGRPWMTANEARALRNMPAIDGGDELVTPLNVLVGGQASPTDSAPPADPTALPAAAAGTPEHKAALFLLKGKAARNHTDLINAVLSAFFDRQGKAVLSALGGQKAKAAPGWWDGERWDRELANDLEQASRPITTELGREEVARLGYPPEEFDPARTANYLKAVAQVHAASINGTTKAQLEAALSDPEGNPASVYELAQRTRAVRVAEGISTFLGGFSSVEAAQQLASQHEVHTTKTWVTGPNARPEHAALDGETVPVDALFSNGQRWPGSASGSSSDIGCNCTLRINPPS